MDEMRARAIVARAKPNDHADWDRWMALIKAENYLAGLEAERERVKLLTGKIEEFRDIVLYERGALAELTEGNPDFINAVLGEFDATVGEVLSAYTTPQNDGQRDST